MFPPNLAPEPPSIHSVRGYVRQGLQQASGGHDHAASPTPAAAQACGAPTPAGVAHAGRVRPEFAAGHEVDRHPLRPLYDAALAGRRESTARKVLKPRHSPP